MRNSSEIWCETTDISIDEINLRAMKYSEAGGFPTLVYISTDLLAELTKGAGVKRAYSPSSTLPGPIVGITTSAGQINVTPVHRLRNFLMVGRREDWQELENAGIDPIFWNDQERARINKEFEKILLEDKDET
jgi:hypothetical protein